MRGKRVCKERNEHNHAMTFYKSSSSKSYKFWIKQSSHAGIKELPIVNMLKINYVYENFKHYK